MVKSKCVLIIKCGIATAAVSNYHLILNFEKLRIWGFFYIFLTNQNLLLMTCLEVLQQLKAMGSESCKSIYLKHGAKEPLFGVKVGDLKKIQKKIKKNHTLSLELYKTGNADAQYLAGLIADESKISASDLESWLEGTNWYMLYEYTIPWVAAESAFGFDLGMKWIDSNMENFQAAGWSTLANYVSIKPDHDLNIEQFRKLLIRVENTINSAPNRTRYTMNGFVIAVGCYIKELSDAAIDVANAIGKVEVKMGETSCKVPYAPDYIINTISKGKLGIKKKMARC